MTSRTAISRIASLLAPLVFVPSVPRLETTTRRGEAPRRSARVPGLDDRKPARHLWFGETENPLQMWRRGLYDRKL